MKYFLRLLLCTLCFSFVGCVSSMMDDGLNVMLNKPVEVSFGVLGYPTSKMQIGGNTLYTWDCGTGGAAFVPTTASSVSTIGYGAPPIYTTTTVNQMVPTHYSGRIQILVNKKGKIINHSWQGQNGALIAPAKQLKRYAKSVRGES